MKLKTDFNFNVKTLAFEKFGKEVASIDFRRDVVGINETIRVVKKLGHAISIYSARAVAVVMADLMAYAQPRVPIDTGRLRESGRALLNFTGGTTFKDIAKGQKDGTVQADFSSINRSRLKNVREIEGNVNYGYIAKDGTDIGIITHEYLNPYGSGESPEARTPGTGPKYLEIAWLQNKDKYLKFMEDELGGRKFETNLRNITRRRMKETKGIKFDYVDLVLDQIGFTGYFGEFL